MRLSTCLVIFICLMQVVAQAQLSAPINKKENTLVTYHLSYGRSLIHEVRVERFIHSNWSLIYSGAYSKNNTISEVSDYRFPVGCSMVAGTAVLFGSYGACSSSFDGMGELIILMAMIPDGLAYHLYLVKNFDISPYLNVSGFSLSIDANHNRFYYAPSAGIRAMKYFGENMVLSGEQTFRRTMSGAIENSIGMSISLRF